MADRNLRIRMLLEAGDRLTKPMREAAAGSSRLATALRATRDRLKDVERAQADLGSFRQLKAGLGDTERAMLEAKARATQLGRELAQTEAPTKKLRTEFQRAKREADSLTTAHRQQSSELGVMRSRLSAAGISTRNLAETERRLRNEASQTNDELRQQEVRLQQVSDRARRFAAARQRFSAVQGTATGLAAGGAAAIGTGMAIAAPLTASVEGAMEYESVMTDINQKVNQSREAGRVLGLHLRTAALAVNQFPSDLQKGVDNLTGFGLAVQDAEQMMTPIGRAATAYKAEIDDLSKATFSVADNLKVPIDQTAKALDVMAQAGKSGAFEVKDMAQYFPELTANMQSLHSTGINAVGDLAAALQITRKGAGDSASAANNLMNLLSKINAGDTIRNFQKFGIDIPAAMKKAARDGRSPIEEIVRLTEQATGGDQAKLSSLFGDMQVQQALRPLMTNMKEYQAIRAEALGASGTVSSDFADRMNDGAEKVKRLQIQTKGLGDTIGGQLAPTVSTGAELSSEWAKKLQDLTNRHPNLTRAAGIAAGVVGGLFLILGGGAIIIAGLIAPFAALAGVATILGIGMLPLIGIALGIVAGIALLAAAAYLIYANWGGITQWFSELWADIKALFFTTLDAIVNAFLNFTPYGLLLKALSPAIAYLRGLNFAEIGRNLIKGLIGGITGMLSALKNTIVNAAASASKWFKEKLGIHSPSRVFHQFGGFMMEGLDGGISASEDRPVERIKAMSADIIRAMAVGAATPAIASAPAMAAFARPAAMAPSGPISITIQQLPGQDGKELARLVAEQIEAIERRKAAAARSSFGDDPDYGAFA